MTRFRQDHVGFIGDVECRFYEVFVTDEHRSFLQFLQRKEGNLNTKSKDFQMSCHVIGGVSSLVAAIMQ